MKNYLLLLSLSILGANTFIVAQEPIKEATIKTAAEIERKDTAKVESQQEPTKKGSSSAKKDSKSEGQNKMAINEQGINKTKPKKKAAASKSNPTTTDTPKEKK